MLFTVYYFADNFRKTFISTDLEGMSNRMVKSGIPYGGDSQQCSTLTRAGFNFSIPSTSNDKNCPSSLVFSINPATAEDECCVRNKIVESKLRAEALWKQGRGYLWMQHSRKAGGTTLCMDLRMNRFGLMQMSHADQQVPTRETCQVLGLCGSDCNYKKQSWYKPGTFANRTLNVMASNQRNFIEIEGAGVPINMLESVIRRNNNSDNMISSHQPPSWTFPASSSSSRPSSLWDKFVFVSTLRDPIDRIVSSIRNYVCRKDETCFRKHKANFVKLDVGATCPNGIYRCHSNYYVRMFSGYDIRYTTDEDMLETAKRNFLRFSCVPLVEYWDETVFCLANLGLHRNIGHHVAFNVANQITKVTELKPNNTTKTSTNTKKTSHQNRTKHQFLSDNEYELIASRNQVDIQFYEWAKDLILHRGGL